MPMFEYDDATNDEIDRVSNAIMEMAKRECTKDGIMDTMTLALAAARVIGSNASLVSAGPELMHRTICEMGDSYRFGLADGGVPN